MKPDGIDDHADSIRFFLWIPDSFPQNGFPSGIRVNFRTVPSKSDFHPVYRSNSGQFPKFFFSIRSVIRTGFEFDIYQSYS